MSDFYKGKKCAICGKDATMAMFGRFLCHSEDCCRQARATRECIGKTMKPCMESDAEDEKNLSKQ